MSDAAYSNSQYCIGAPFISLPATYSMGFWVSAVSSPSGVWGGAPAANDFGAFYSC